MGKYEKRVSQLKQVSVIGREEVMINFINNIVDRILLLILDIITRRFGGKKQFLPSLEDIKNEELKELANKLKADSNEEKLTNILEWEDRNIVGWDDRMYMFFILYILLILSSYFLPIDPFSKSLFILFLILMGLVNFTIVLSNYLLLISFIIVLFSWIFLVNPTKAQEIFPVHYFVLLSILFGVFIGLIVYLLLKYRGIKYQNPEFRISDTFELTLPVNKIIKYKLAICRDYAKLTATLLFQDLNSKVYFFLIPGHVAVAVKIKNEYYILDQKLPVLTKDSWLKSWNRKDASVYVSELVRNSKGELIDVNFKKHENVDLSDSSRKDVNTAELTENVSKILGISQISHEEMSIFKLILKNCAVYYEDDAIVKYSLIRAIKNKLENDFCNNKTKISKIKINQDDKDNKNLILEVFYDVKVDRED